MEFKFFERYPGGFEFCCFITDFDVRSLLGFCKDSTGVYIDILFIHVLNPRR